MRMKDLNITTFDKTFDLNKTHFVVQFCKDYIWLDAYNSWTVDQCKAISFAIEYRKKHNYSTRVVPVEKDSFSEDNCFVVQSFCLESK